MLPSPLRGVLFDLDGTLIDSGADLARAANLLLAELGLSPLPPAQVRSFIGRGARALVARTLEAADPEQRIARDDPRLRRFLPLYESVLLETTTVFAGVADGLARLLDAGLLLAIVTNKPIAPTRVLVRALGLEASFGVVLGGDSLPTRKPDPAMLHHAAGALGLGTESCALVGDSDVDIEAAAAAGCRAWWCAWGGIHPDRPVGGRPVATFPQLVDELLAEM